MSVRPVVLLGGKAVGVSTPFINAFQKKKAWNLPKSSTNLNDFKTYFFPPQMWRFKKKKFPSWKCGNLVFFLEIFQNSRFTMYVFMGDFSTDFRHKKKKTKKEKKKALCCAFVCVSLDSKAVLGWLHFN